MSPNGPSSAQRHPRCRVLAGLGKSLSPSALAGGEYVSMPLQWFSVVIDCDDPDRLAEFWCQVLDYQVVYRTDDIVDIAKDTETFPGIEFIRAKHRENRKSPLHLDLNPKDQATEVDRLLALGAQRIDVGQGKDAAWVVLADPEGNAFCVLAQQPGLDAPP